MDKAMKLEIEITPEDAACLFADNWESRPVEQVIETMVEEAADRYRASFPQPVVESNVQGDGSPDTNTQPTR